MPLERDIIRVRRTSPDKAVQAEEQLSINAPLKAIRDFEERKARGEALTQEDESQFQALLKEKAELKSKRAQVLERGMTTERLRVDLPNDLYGEWVPDYPEEVARAESLGFWIDREHAKKRRLHSDGSEASYIGDAVFMVTTKENYELLEEIRLERKLAMHGEGGKDKEEKDYSAKVRSEAPEVPVIDDSKTKRVGRSEIEAALGYK